MTTLSNLETTINFFWTIFGTVLVFWMHAGFSLLEAGSIRHKNIVSIMYKNLLNVIISSLLWWLLGYSLAFGESNKGIIGGADIRYYTTNQLYQTQQVNGTQVQSSQEDQLILSNWLFQWAFSATSLTIISGGMAERVQPSGYLILILGFQILIYPPIAHWCWHDLGWLKVRGFVDFAGSGVVHTVGGFASLIGCILLGPRKGRLEAHSIPLVVLGTFILWMGWFGFNGASTNISGDGMLQRVGATLINMTISASTAGVTTVFVLKFMTKKYKVGEMCNGILSGLVSISASGPLVADWAAFIIGLIASLVYLLSTKMLNKMRIDDAIGAFPVHGACGVWGILAAGLFHKENGGLYLPTESNIFGVQCYGILAIIGWTCALSFTVLMICKLFKILRIPEQFEAAGIDRYCHTPETKEFDHGIGFLADLFKY